MFKYNRTTLTKLETILKQQDYTVRYERGNFQSGYCIVENRNVAVINKFFDVEARINILIEILGTFEVDPEKLDEASQEMYNLFAKMDGDKKGKEKEPKKTKEVSEETTPETSPEVAQEG